MYVCMYVIQLRRKKSQATEFETIVFEHLQSLVLKSHNSYVKIVLITHLPQGMSAERRSSIDLPCGNSAEKQTPSKAMFLNNEVASFHCISLFNAQSHAKVSDVIIL